MKKNIVTAWTIIAIIVGVYFAGIDSLRHRTAPIRKGTIAYVNGAMKNGVITQEEGRRMVRYMSVHTDCMSHVTIKADKVRSEVDAAYQRARNLKQYDYGNLRTICGRFVSNNNQ